MDEFQETREDHTIVPPKVTDPLFNNVVHAVSRQCIEYIRRNGDRNTQYYAGVSSDLLVTFGNHKLPEFTTFMVRDGLDFFAACGVLKELIEKGCSGDIPAEECKPASLYLYRIIYGITVQ